MHKLTLVVVHLKALDGKGWKTALLLSIFVPISLLATFRLTGIIKEPTMISKTITLDVVEWEFTRPLNDQFISINESVNAVYDSDDIKVNYRVFIAEYVPGSWEWTPPGPYLDMAIEINSSVTNAVGFIETVHATFKNFQPSSVIFLRTFLNSVNLSLIDIMDGNLGEDGRIFLAGVNHPSESYFSAALFHWFLLTQNTQESQMEVMFEIIYYDGAVYSKMIQPFRLTIMGRAN